MAMNKCNSTLEEIDTTLTKFNTVLKVLVNKRIELQNHLNHYGTILDKHVDKNLDNEVFEWTGEVHEILRHTFKFKSFRPKQLSTINSLLQKRDVILIMPTAGGKTLTYLIPTILRNSLTLVVSPSLASIEDQIISLNKFGIEAGSINTNIARKVRKSLQNSMVTIDSPLRVLFVTVDWFFNSKLFMNYIQKSYDLKILSRIVIEEIQCCSLKGHDFHEVYQKFECFKDKFPDIPILGLSANATKEIVIDIKNHLNLMDVEIYNTSLNRPNLFYKVAFKPENEKCFDIIANWIKNKYEDKSGIIFVANKEETKLVRNSLVEHGVNVCLYHEELTFEQKCIVHRQWLDNTYQVIVATAAFGLGIDKPDVRFVIHYSMPISLGSYYQEIGRAGRDGLHADCILMFELSDYLEHISRMNQTQLEQLNKVLAYCVEQKNCRRALIMEHLNEPFNPSDCDRMCDICTNTTQLTAYILNDALNNIIDVIQTLSVYNIKVTPLKLITSLEDVFQCPKPKQYQEYLISYLMRNKYLIVEKYLSLPNTITSIRNNKCREWPQHIIMYHRDDFNFLGIFEQNLTADDYDSMENTALESPLLDMSLNTNEICGIGTEMFDCVDQLYDLTRSHNGADNASLADYTATNIYSDSDITSDWALPQDIRCDADHILNDTAGKYNFSTDFDITSDWTLPEQITCEPDHKLKKAAVEYNFGTDFYITPDWILPEKIIETEHNLVHDVIRDTVETEFVKAADKPLSGEITCEAEHTSKEDIVGDAAATNVNTEFVNIPEKPLSEEITCEAEHTLKEDIVGDAAATNVNTEFVNIPEKPLSEEITCEAEHTLEEDIVGDAAATNVNTEFVNIPEKPLSEEITCEAEHTLKEDIVGDAAATDVNTEFVNIPEKPLSGEITCEAEHTLKEDIVGDAAATDVNTEFVNIPEKPLSGEITCEAEHTLKEDIVGDAAATDVNTEFVNIPEKPLSGEITCEAEHTLKEDIVGDAAATDVNTEFVNIPEKPLSGEITCEAEHTLKEDIVGDAAATNVNTEFDKTPLHSPYTVVVSDSPIPMEIPDTPPCILIPDSPIHPTTGRKNKRSSTIDDDDEISTQNSKCRKTNHSISGSKTTAELNVIDLTVDSSSESDSESEIEFFM